MEQQRKGNAMVDYSSFVEHLQWICSGDKLFRDGADHYQIDRARFELDAKRIAPLAGLTVCEIGSFRGFGMRAFRGCARYIGMGRCPAWYESVLVEEFGAEWFACDLEADTDMPDLQCHPDVVILQEVLEHIRRPKALLTRIYAWMPAGARLYLTTNNLHYIGYLLKMIAGREIFDSVMTENSVYPGHCTYYSLSGLTTLLTDIGFIVESSSRVNLLPAARFYRNRAFAFAKNCLTKSVPTRYATHIELVCRKSSTR
jgi:hypothetical protein